MYDFVPLDSDVIMVIDSLPGFVNTVDTHGIVDSWLTILLVQVSYITENSYSCTNIVKS